MSAVLKSESPSVVLRPMRPGDVAAAVAVEHAAYDFPWTERIFRDCLRVGYCCWVLVVDGVTIGYGILAAGAAEAHLLNICVDPREQGKGWGQRLLKRMLDLARWHGAHTVFLEVRPTNVGAIALYERYGFRVIGVRPDYYRSLEGREDAVVMALDLRSQRRAAG